MKQTTTLYDFMKASDREQRYETLFNTLAQEVEAIESYCDDSVIRKANRFSLNRVSPVPLWLMARVRAIGFRSDDLLRTHWNKVWRSMVED